MRCIAALSIILTCISALDARALPAWRQVIPAAASTGGAMGSHWRTDVVVHNPAETPAYLELTLLGDPVGGLPGSGDTVAIPDPLAAGGTIILTDVVASFFPERSSGALIVVARDGDGRPLPIVATSRTWTDSEDGAGSFGQGIPATSWAEEGELNPLERRIVGMMSTDDVRTNVGLVNLSEMTQGTFSIEILDGDGQSLASHWFELPPRTRIQWNRLPAYLGLEGSNLSAVVHLAGWSDMTPGVPQEDVGAPDWVAYASVVDNRTNDPAFIEALDKTTRWGIERQRIVPAAAHTAGMEGSNWISDVFVRHDPGGEIALLEVSLITSADLPKRTGEKYVFLIQPGQTLALGDVIGEYFPDHELGALNFRAWDEGGLVDVTVGSRTWTQSNGGAGTFGQAIAGLPRRYGSDAVAVPGLTGTPSFRSNLGIVNPSTNLRETFSVEILDPGGQAQATFTRTLDPLSHLQINDLIDETGLEGEGFTAIVSLLETENLFLKPSDSWDPIFIAYGSVVDNETNDPTFIAGTPLVPPDDTDRGAWFDFSGDEPWYRCPNEPSPAEATVVRTFDRAYHYFGDEDHRTIVGEFDFPETDDWNQIGLRINLECPQSGDCDDWDRTGSLQLVLNPDDPEDQWEYLELARYITPYHMAMCEYIDVTALAPVLTGRRTLVSWIDTWVGPGNASGEGWRITYDFVFYPGERRTPVEVRNIWGRRTVTVGNPEGNPIEDQVVPVPLDIPADVTRVEARLITTGHAFVNGENCAEFCPLRQDVYVDGELLSVLPWRTDCEYNPHSPQAGTWTYDRNGWCPGAVVVGDTLDLTGLVTPGATSGSRCRCFCTGRGPN